jgi:hypothetical protein
MRKGRGEIIKINTLFEKYKNVLRAPQSTVVDAFCEVVEELIGVPITSKNITYTVSSRTLSVRVSGPIRSEIRLHEGEILNHLKGRLGERNAPLRIL